MTTTTKTRGRTKKAALAAATGTVRVIRGMGAIPGQPDTAEIAINGGRYLCRCLPNYIELVKSCGAGDDEPECYHVPADLTDCTCADCTYRQRQCKHIGAIKALRAAGRIG